MFGLPTELTTKDKLKRDYKEIRVLTLTHSNLFTVANLPLVIISVAKPNIPKLK